MQYSAPVHDFAGPCYENEESYDRPNKQDKRSQYDDSFSRMSLQVYEGAKGGVVSILAFIKPRSILLFLGTLVMVLLLAIPAWNAIAMLENRVFAYLIGTETCSWLLACCVLLVVTTYIFLQVLLSRIKPKYQTEQTMFMISGAFLSVLAIMLIVFGHFIENDARRASSELANGCLTGSIKGGIGRRTEDLVLASYKLQSLRAMPNCKDRGSIEECAGFGDFSEMEQAEVLKSMEWQYQCAGICHRPINATQTTQTFPPTLFSQANWQVSCDGMAARHLVFFGAGAAETMVGEGRVLMGTAIVMGIAQIAGFCGKKPEEEALGKSYGATL